MGRRRLRPRVRAGNQTLPERGEPAGGEWRTSLRYTAGTRMRRLILATAALLATLPGLRLGLAAVDWPQYLGEGRDGVYKGAPLADSWPATGPRAVWKKQVGAGFSGPVVAAGKLVLFHRVGAEEVVEAMDVATGASQWRYAYPTTYRDDFGFDEGPARRAGGGQRDRLHLRRAGTAARGGPGRRQEALERRHGHALPRREGLFRLRGIAARRRRPRDRQHRREGRRHRRLRRRHGQGAVDGDRRRGQLLLAGGRDVWWQASGSIPDPLGAGRPGSRHWRRSRSGGRGGLATPIP